MYKRDVMLRCAAQTKQAMLHEEISGHSNNYITKRGKQIGSSSPQTIFLVMHCKGRATSVSSTGRSPKENLTTMQPKWTKQCQTSTN
jgi:hypothetical protein